jgi:hypothetical protein
LVETLGGEVARGTRVLHRPAQFAQASGGDRPDEASARRTQVEGLLDLALTLAAAGRERENSPVQAQATLPANTVVNPFPLEFKVDEEGQFWVFNKFGERTGFEKAKQLFDLAQLVYNETHTGGQVSADEVSKRFWLDEESRKNRGQNLRTATSEANGPLGRVRCQIKGGDRKLWVRACKKRE